MTELNPIIALMFFPGGIFVMLLGLLYVWINRKLRARLQNRVGPRWFQPIADLFKLLSKEEIIPEDANPTLFVVLPVLALAGVLTAALYVPILGMKAVHSVPGDLIITVYLLSLVTMCIGLAGANSTGRFSLVGVTRTLTQLFSYEARFIIAIVALMGKLEMPPFDAPEAETEIVGGALTEYNGRGLALFKLSHAAEMVIGFALVTALFMGGTTNPLLWAVQTLVLLLVVTLIEVLMARMRIDQTVGLWWRYGSVLAIVQIIVLVVWQRIVL